jgi:hypothetical protein
MAFVRSATSNGDGSGSQMIQRLLAGLIITLLATKERKIEQE